MTLLIYALYLEYHFTLTQSNYLPVFTQQDGECVYKSANGVIYLAFCSVFVNERAGVSLWESNIQQCRFPNELDFNKRGKLLILI